MAKRSEDRRGARCEEEADRQSTPCRGSAQGAQSYMGVERDARMLLAGWSVGWQKNAGRDGIFRCDANQTGFFSLTEVCCEKAWVKTTLVRRALYAAGRG
jgi:hypothetical protein